MLAPIYPFIGVLFFYTVLGVTCGYALWRGGGPERVVSAFLLVAAIASDLLYRGYGLAFSEVEAGVAIIDHLLLAGLMAVMIRARRIWPIIMVALHLLATSSHWVRIEDGGLLNSAYAVVAMAWAYPMQLTLAFGTMLHRHRVRKFGADSSWLPSLVPFHRPQKPSRIA